MHVRNLRCMHDAPQDVLLEAYPEEEFWQDLLKVTGGNTDEQLARYVIRASSTCRPWMYKHGGDRRFQPFALGHAAPVPHQCVLHGRRQGPHQCLLSQRAGTGQCRCATTHRWTGSRSRTAASSPPGWAKSAWVARACVLAAGGFESNREWMREAWGRNERGEWPADNFLVRGTRFNQGVLLKDMQRQWRRHHRRPDADALRRRSTRACRSTTAASARASMPSRWA